MGYQRFDVKPDRLQMLLNAYKINGPKMGKILGVNHGTGRSRVNDPSKLTVGELRKLMKHIPRDQILSAI